MYSKKIENELSVCYALGTMVDIIIQATLMMADISININLDLVRINH